MEIGSPGCKFVALAASSLVTSALGGPLATESARAGGEPIQLAQVAAPSAVPAASGLPAPGSRTALGDLSAIRALAVDALRAAQAGDLRAARARVKELDESWERSAPKMKTLAPAKWEAVEAAIDRAGRELRFWRARRTDSVEALQALISTIDSLG
jgi:hypothetical protein